MKTQAEDPEDVIIDPNKIDVDLSGRQTGGYGGMDDSMMMMDDMMSGEEDMSMMMGGTSAGMKGKPAEENPVDFKLLRFYDFAFVRGKARDPNAPRLTRKYVYRIRFGVNDPNFPQDAQKQPLAKSLAPDAYSRYVELAAKARQTQKRDFIRWSDWSEPSEPTTLPPLDRAFVGDVVADNKSRRAKLGNRSVVIESDSPTAEVVASSFDPRLGAFVPALVDAKEGTVLGKEVPAADVVDPITLEVKKLENATVNSAATVIDIEGGLPLEIVEEPEMTEPGLFLMIDSNGKLQVKDSVEEQRVYRIKSFADERGK